MPGDRASSRPDAAFAAVLSRRRVDAIENLIRGRHGGPCDTDEGGIYWTVALPHLLILLPYQFMRCDPIRWGCRWTPRFISMEGEAKAERLVASHLRRPRYRSDAVLGRELQVTAAECRRFNLHGIAPCDVSSTERKDAAKAREAARKRQAREAKGSRPQRLSEARMKPWLAMGISQRTYRRRQAAARGTISSGQLSTRVGSTSLNCADEMMPSVESEEPP